MPSSGNRFDAAMRIVAGAYLLLLCCWLAGNFSTAMTLPWYSSSDETVIASEVIRFSTFDFHQKFFDMPGTPLMLFGAAEWTLCYWWATLFQGFHGEINTFSFQHLQQLIELLRIENLIFFLLSAALLFRLVFKIANVYAAAIASTLLLLNPASLETAGFVRVEPLTACLMLSSILVLSDTRWKWRMFVAGLLGGLAIACRLHASTAVLPILVFLVIQETWGQETSYDQRQKVRFAGLGATLLLWGALLFGYFQFVRNELHTTYPLAFGLFAKAGLLLALAVAALGSLYFVPKTRRLVVNTITVQLVVLCAGVGIGFLAGTPTVFTRFAELLKSLEFYLGPGYKDAVASHLPFAQKISSYWRFYLKEIAPDYLTLALLAVGVALVICSRRWRTLWPYLAVGLIFFVSKPLDLRRAAHHVALWIPFYAALSAVPVAALYKKLEAKGDVWRHALAMASLLFALILSFDLKNEPRILASVAQAHRERLENIERLQLWIQTNTPADSSLWIAFYCFGPQVFYSWFEEYGLKIPRGYQDGREYFKWWGSQSEIKGHTGLACLTPTDVTNMRALEAGEAIDPPRDARFHKLRSFGQGPNEIIISQFNLSTGPSPVRPTGFTFSMHSALPLGGLALAYQKASIHGRGPFIVTTSSEPWSFAASLPINVNRAIDSDLWLHLRARVLKGRIGASLYDRQKGLLNEEFLEPSADTEDFYFKLPAGIHADDLMMRNARASGESEIALDDSEVLARAHASSPVARLEDIQPAFEKASVTSKPPVIVTTFAQQWSFAAVVPVHAVSTRGMVLKLRGRVLQGKIGFSFLGADGHSVQREQTVDPSKDPIEMFLPLEPSADSKLLIRNVAPNGTVSKLQIDSIETWQLY